MVQRVQRAVKALSIVVFTLLLQGCYFHPVAPVEFRLLRVRAQSGETEAQVKVASMLLCRPGCGFGAWRPKCDEAEAATWYKKAAEGGNAEAQTMIGHTFLIGHILSPREAYLKPPAPGQNTSEAKKWYRAAAAQNYLPAYQALARLAVDEKSDAEAAFWYEKAAAAGDKSAQLKLAELYAAGRGVAQDTQKARDWAAKSGSDNLKIAEIFAGTNPPDYAQAYYWAGLQAETRKMYAGGRTPLPSSLAAIQQADKYKAHLGAREISDADARIDTKISASCDAKFAWWRKHKYRASRWAEDNDTQFQYCLTRQKK